MAMRARRAAWRANSSRWLTEAYEWIFDAKSGGSRSKCKMLLIQTALYVDGNAHCEHYAANGDVALELLAGHLDRGRDVAG